MPPKPARSLSPELRDVTPPVRKTAVRRPRIALELALSFDQGGRVRDDQDTVGCSLSSRIVPFQAGRGTLAVNQVAGRVIGPDPYTPLVILLQSKLSVRQKPNLRLIIRTRSRMSNSRRVDHLSRNQLAAALVDALNAIRFTTNFIGKCKIHVGQPMSNPDGRIPSRSA